MHVNYWNAGQADDRWGPTEMYGGFRIGRCGCQLATYSGMLWRHLHAAPGPYGAPPLSPQPHFPTIVHDYVVQPFEAYGWARRFVVASHEASIISPTYIDQWLRRPNAAYGNAANWGYQDKSGRRIGCGSPVSPWAMEALAVPPVVTFPTPDGPVEVQAGATGIAVDMYQGFAEGVVRRNLARGEPTIVGRQYRDGSGGHYQVIVGWNHREQRFMYRDPVDSTGTALLRMAGSSDEYQTWLGEIVETVDVRPSFGRMSHLVLQDDPSPIELSAVLPDGTQVGYDAATGERVTIPGNYMYELRTTGPADGTTEPPVDPVRGLMTTNNPIGVTRTTITGTGTGTYEVDIFDLDAEGGRTDLGSVGGAIAEGQEVKHEVTYDQDGVVDAVQVDNFTPEPDVADVEVVAGEPVVLDASGSFDVDGEVVDWAWDLGDGSTAAGEQVTHTFEAPGTYAVALTVTDDQGATRTEVVEVEVAPSELDAPALEVTTDPASGWATDDVTVDVTATDAGSGVAAVTTSATGADEQAETTTPGDSATVVVEAEGRTTVRAVATDRMGNVAGAELVEVGVDRTAPEAVVRTPSAAQPASRLAVLGGTATDQLSGVASVEAQVRRADGRTWDGTAWVEGEAWLPADGTTAWSLVDGLPGGADLPDGDYEVRARATDVAGNAGDASAPVVATVRAAAGGLPVVELGSIDDRSTAGYDVDDDGRAVGTAGRLGVVDPRPIAWAADGTPNPLPLASGHPGGEVVAVNGAADAAGWVVGALGQLQAAAWVDGEVVPLGSFTTGGRSTARDIDDDGVVVGSSTYTSSTSQQRAARFAGGFVSILPDLGGSSSEATASNEHGVVVGWSHLPGHGTERAFVLPAGATAAQALPALPIPEDPDAVASNIAYDVNDAGTIVGSDTGRAVRWEDGEVVDLGDGEAFAVDEDGTAVGVTYTDDGMRAMLWEGTQPTDLNDLIDAGSGWVLERAEGISDDGRYVTGTGQLAGEARGFVLDLGGSTGGSGDATAPSTTATAPGGWSADAVEVALSATDTGSGVARIVTNVGTVEGDTGSVIIDAEGESTVRLRRRRRGRQRRGPRLGRRAGRPHGSLRHGVDPGAGLGLGARRRRGRRP